MRGVRGDAVGLEELLGVSVVGGDEAHAAEARHALDDTAEAAVGLLDRGDDRGDHAGVADHVGVREVHERRSRSRSPISAQNRSATSSADIAGARS